MKQCQISVHCLAVLSHRQAVHNRTPKWGEKLTCRLAAHACLPGSFLAEPKIVHTQRK